MREYRIKILIFLCALILHALLIISLFVPTHGDFLEPLRLTINPRPIEYSLYTQPNQPTAKPVLPAQPPQAADQPPQQVLPEDDNQAESYLLQNPLSGGSLTQGSIVTAAGGGDNIQLSDSQQNMIDQSNKQEEQYNEPDDQSMTHEQTEQLTDIKQQDMPEAHDATDISSHLNEFNEPIIPVPSNATTTLCNTGRSSSQAIKQPAPPKSQQQEVQKKPARLSANPAERKKIPPAKQLSLADITQSYLRQMRQPEDDTGQYTYGAHGLGAGPMGPNGAFAPPTPGVELAEQIYASKLYALLGQSAQSYSRQIFSLNDIKMQTVIEISIDRSGKILDVKLNPALPEKDMEQALCTIVRRVGMFPPIPKQFKKTQIILNIPIHIQSQKGFASYRLLYGQQV